MKVHIDRGLLAEGINIVQKAVAARTTSPILECILLCAENEHLTLTANNLELGIESIPLPAYVAEPGLLALNARTLGEIIRKVQGDDVIIESNEKFLTNISCGPTRFKQILGLDGASFPALPEVPRENPYTMEQGLMKDMIRQTIFSIAQEEIKPVLTGEFLEIGNEKVNLVSVDGYRISYREAPMPGCSEYFSAIVPGKAMNELNRLLDGESKDPLKIYFTERHVMFENPSCVLVSRLIEGDYIKYRQSFGGNFSTQAEIDREALLSAIDRATILTTDLRKTPVKLKVEEGVLAVSSNSEMGATYEELPITQDGPDLVIAFNPRYVSEALKAIDEERVLLQFSTSLSPMIINSVQKTSDYLYLILPLRM